MNAIQKAIVVLGLVAIAVSASMAPYRVTYTVKTLGPVVFDYPAPLWNAPSVSDSAIVAMQPAPGFSSVESVELETGKLALTWVAIAIATLGLVALTSKRKA